MDHERGPVRDRGDGRAEAVRLEGLHALKHALRFGAQVLDARTSDRAAVLDLAAVACPDLLGRLDDLLVEVGPGALGPVAGGRLPSPVVATAVPTRWSVADLARRPDRPVVLLERPTSLGNLGACVRVAAAADAAGVVVLAGADPWHPLALRGGAGLQWALPVVALDELDEGASGLQGRALVAVDPTGDRDAPVPAGAVLAFGSERTGLTAALRDRAGAVLALPMRPGVSSLNLATSVAATLYAHAPPG